MAFTGFPFPGITVQGIIPDAIKERLFVFNAKALNALNTPPNDQIAWIEAVSDVGAADFVEKIPIDITALNGFKPFKGGARDYKTMDLIAVAVEITEWDLPFNYHVKLLKTPELMNIGNAGAAIVGHARSLRAELGASVLMQSVDSRLYTSLAANNLGLLDSYTPTALCYPEIGFVNGMELFSSTDGAASNHGGHLVNPRDSRFGRFPNYFPGFGKFNETNFALMRMLMRTVPSPVTDRRTLGGQVRVVTGPSHMEEPFRNVYLSTITLKQATISGNGVAASGTGIYAASMTPWVYQIASQLDHHPYLENFRQKYASAHGGTLPTVDQLPHCWMTSTTDLSGAHPLEFAAPSASFMPTITIFGPGSEHTAETKMVSIIPDLEAGCAPGIPHVCQWFEEDRG
jgi:hypothetical protein